MNLLELTAPLLMARPHSGEQYYAFRFIGLPNGRIERSCQSTWVGFENGDKRKELRRAIIWEADEVPQFRETLRTIGEDCMVVRTPADFQLFYLVGGNAFVETKLADGIACLRSLIGDRVCVRTGPTGFQSLDDLPRDVLNRAPTPKRRMAVIRRDDLRCRICGRRATDDVDVQLHVHHIRPWANGGVTTEENLITLCHTCHAGLQPHGDLSLFSLLGPTVSEGNRDKRSTEYAEGLRLYLNIARRAIETYRGRYQKEQEVAPD